VPKIVRVGGSLT